MLPLHLFFFSKMATDFTQVTVGGDLGKGHSPSEILNRNERLFSAFSLFSPQRVWLKDSK